MAYEIAVIGNKDAVSAFKMVGLKVFDATTGDQARQLIKELAEDNYAVIFLTESLVEQIPETMAEYDLKYLPALIPIPDGVDSSGLGMERISRSASKAIGQNIF